MANDLARMRKHAQRCADWNLVPYRIFLDTSGVLRAERYKKTDEWPKWSNATSVEVVHPRALDAMKDDPILAERHGLVS